MLQAGSYKLVQKGMHVHASSPEIDFTTEFKNSSEEEVAHWLDNPNDEIEMEHFDL